MTVIRMREEGIMFIAKHTIPAFPEGDRDRTPHEHVYRVATEVSVKVDVERGYAFDHRIIAEGVNDCTAVLDGGYINSVPGLERGLVEDILLVHFVPRLREYFAIRTATLQLVELRQVGYMPDFSTGRTFDFSRPTGRDHVKIWRADEN
jgi:6-pyruvoyl-tetrahydropterin synthase